MARVEDFGWLRVEFDGDRKDRFGEWFDGEADVDSFGVALAGSSSEEGDDAAFVDGVGGRWRVRTQYGGAEVGCEERHDESRARNVRRLHLMSAGTRVRYRRYSSPKYDSRARSSRGMIKRTPITVPAAMTVNTSGLPK